MGVEFERSFRPALRVARVVVRLPLRPVIRPELRPLRVGEIVDVAIKLVISNARVLFTISAIVLIPLGLVQGLVTALGVPDQLDFFDSFMVDETVTQEEAEELLSSALQLFAVGVTIAAITGLGTVLVQGASAKALADVYQSTEPSWQNSLRFGLKRFFPILWATILILVASSVGLLFYLAPGIWLFTSWSVTTPVLVVENKGPLQAMARSFDLVRRRFWPALGTVALSYLVYFAVGQVIGLITSAITFAGGSTTTGTDLWVSTIGSTISSVFVLPFLAAVFIVLYFDLRVRAEGYDLQVMAAEMEQTQPSLPPTTEPDDPFGLGSPGRE